MAPLIFLNVYSTFCVFLWFEAREKYLQKINGTSSESNQAKSYMFGSAEPFPAELSAKAVGIFSKFQWPLALLRCPLFIRCRKYVTSMRKGDAQ